MHWQLYSVMNYVVKYFEMKHGYSRLSIKCVGWNKHVGWKFFEDQIKVLDGISMLVGKCLDNH